MINAGFCLFCSYPANLNTYTGCSHACKYCYASKSKDINNIKPLNCKRELLNFIAGKRTRVTSFLDWDIPLHLGTKSDPFQPCEAKYRATLRVLEIFARTGYPFIVTTKGRLVAEEPYLTLLAKCNVVVQVSLVCPDYDKMETGAPPYYERLEIIRKLTSKGIRVVVRVQPLMVRYTREVAENRIKEMAQAGIYGVMCGGYYSATYHDGMERGGSGFRYKTEVLARSLIAVKEACHKNGIVFNTGNSRFRAVLSDEQCCCGTAGLDRFKPNGFLADLILEGKKVKPTNAMQKIGSAAVFRTSIQNSVKGNIYNKMSYEQYVRLYCQEWGEKYFRERSKCEQVFKNSILGKVKQKNGTINGETENEIMIMPYGIIW